VMVLGVGDPRHGVEERHRAMEILEAERAPQRLAVFRNAPRRDEP